MSGQALQLRVVGSSSSIPRPNRASSTYVVQGAGTTIVLDLGMGGFAAMRAHLSVDRLDAVLITHMHADHFLDVIPLRYALRYGTVRRADRLPLWLPPGGTFVLRSLCSAFLRETEDEFLDTVFQIREYDPHCPLQIGALSLTFAPTVHYIPAYAVRVVCGERTFVYSGDTAPCDDVVRLARDAHLFCCEATLGLGGEDGEPRGHCSAEEAAVMAQRAGVGVLLLSHYGDEWTPEQLLEGASRAFTGTTIVADDGTTLDV